MELSCDKPKKDKDSKLEDTEETYWNNKTHKQ